MSDYGERPDGSAKGKGYFGELVNKAGDVVTELTVGVNIDGQEVDIPLVHPFMSGEDINKILELGADEPIPKALVQGAVDFAIYRKQQGLPMYATAEEEGKIPVPKGVKSYKSTLGINSGKSTTSKKSKTYTNALGVK